MSEYITTYFYRVPREQITEFKRIQFESAAIYKQYGAVADITYVGEMLEDKYGCTGTANALTCDKNEVLFFSVTRFLDKQHHDEVIEKVDRDVRIEKLFNQMISILDINRVVRGEFSSI